MSRPNNDSAQYAILRSRPHDGFYIIGPFECVDDAMRYRETDPEPSRMLVFTLQIPAYGYCEGDKVRSPNSASAGTQ